MFNRGFHLENQAGSLSFDMHSSVYSLWVSTGDSVPLLHSPGIDIWALVCRVPQISHNIPYSEEKLHANIMILVKVFITILR